MIRVRAQLGDKGVVEIRPASFLGDVYFAAYRSAVSGTKYDRVRKAQTTTPKRWPALRARMLEMGFSVHEDDKLLAALAALCVEDFETGVDGALEARVKAAETRAGLSLYDYQWDGVRFLSAHQSALLADEQGLGKTLQTCLAVPDGVSVLVVAPVAAQGVWRDAVSGPPGQPRRALRPELEVVTVKERKGLPTPKPGLFALATYEDVTRAIKPAESRERRCAVGSLVPGCPTQAAADLCALGGASLPLSAPLPPPYRKSVTELMLLGSPSLRLRLPCAERGKLVPAIRQLCAQKLSPRCKAFVRTTPAYDLVIADEAHYLKNPKSQRNQAFRALADAGRRVWLLTGTPLPSTPPELWAVLDAANIAERAFGSFDEFAELFGAETRTIERWDNFTKTRKKVRFLEWPKDRAPDIESKLSDAAAQALGRVMLRRTKKDKLDLPEKVYRVVPVTVPKKVDALLEAARAKILADLGVDLAVDEDLDEKVPFTKIASVRAEVAAAKVPALLELLDMHEEAGERVIVFSSHLDPLRKVAARKGWGAITGETSSKDRREAERAFQAGELVGLACSTRAAGTALTLHRATVEIFLDRDWVPANNAQAEDRAHRIGTDHVVTVEDLVSDHPIDRHVSEVLARKSRLISTTLSRAEDV